VHLVYVTASFDIISILFWSSCCRQYTALLTRYWYCVLAQDPTTDSAVATGTVRSTHCTIQYVWTVQALQLFVCCFFRITLEILDLIAL